MIGGFPLSTNHIKLKFMEVNLWNFSIVRLLLCRLSLWASAVRCAFGAASTFWKVTVRIIRPASRRVLSSLSSYKLFWCSRHKSIRFLHGCLRRKYVFYGNVLLYRYKSNAEYRACYRPAVLLLAAFDIYDHSCVTRNITAIQAVRGSCSGWLFNSFLAEQNIIRCMCSCFNVLESTSGKSAAGF